MIQMMKRMAKDHQVISISHLPQFAAGGDAHYFVYKDNSSDRSISKIKMLSNEEAFERIKDWEIDIAGLREREDESVCAAWINLGGYQGW